MYAWTIFQIAEQVQLASRKSREVEDALAAPDKSMQKAAALLHEIKLLASAHERVSARLRYELDPFDPAIEIAERLTDHWRLLSTALIARLGNPMLRGSVSTDLRLSAHSQVG